MSYGTEFTSTTKMLNFVFQNRFSFRKLIDKTLSLYPVISVHKSFISVAMEAKAVPSPQALTQVPPLHPSSISTLTSCPPYMPEPSVQATPTCLLFL